MSDTYTATRRPDRRRSSNRASLLALATILSAVGLLIPKTRAAEYAPATPEFFPDWSHVETPFYPLYSATLQNPVLTKDDVTDSQAYFVADPFLFPENDLWYMFFEVESGYGKIGLAESVDGIHWTYDRIVLDVHNHLSYPYVFKFGNDYFMVPESGYAQAVNLYRATSFPSYWQLVSTLVSGRTFADPVIIYQDRVWYLFVSSSDSFNLYLYYSHNLVGGWAEHPMSPIVRDRGKARPAGRFITFGTDHLIRLAQKSDAHYGQGVRAFQIDTLTTSRYAEHEIAQSPILLATGVGWNADGMHQCDPWWAGDRWLASVDGLAGGVWSIGIHATVPVPQSGLPPAEPLTQALRLASCAPDPFAERASLVYQVNDAADSGPTDLRVYDMGGRCVRTLLRRAEPSGRYCVWWDGRDDSGRPAAPGVYFCRLSRGSQSATRTVVRLR